MSFGAIDYLVFTFNNEKLKGEILTELLDLVQKKIVRVIDLIIIQKYEDGKYEALEIEQLGPDLLGVFDPLGFEISGLIQVEDIEMIAAEMAANTTAALLLVENLWSIKFGEAVLRADGRVVAHERIPFEVVNETLEIFAQADLSAEDKLNQK
jgi:hypothetical protein